MAEFERAVSEANSRRERTWNSAELLEAGLGTDGRSGEKYVGEKWGARFLRAPDIYRHIISRYSNLLVRLGGMADVRSGIMTGAKDFFCLTEETINRWNLESAYMRPVMTSPLESRSVMIDPKFLPKRIFMCHHEIIDLNGTGALDYIRWGESQGYHQRSSSKSRPRWYDLGRKDEVHLALAKFADTTSRSYYSASSLLFTDNFQTLTIRGNVSAVPVCAVLNSTLFQLMFFTEARAHATEGVRSIQTRGAAELLVVDPTLLGELDAAILDSSDWDVLKPSTERLAIDACVFDTLELTRDERDAVYEGEMGLVSNRTRPRRAHDTTAPAFPDVSLSYRA